MRRYIIICIGLIIGLAGCTNTTSDKTINDRLCTELMNKYGEEFTITEESVVDASSMGVPGYEIGYQGKASTSSGEQFDVCYRLSDNKLLDTYAEVVYSNSDIESRVKNIVGNIEGVYVEQVEVNHLSSSVNWKYKELTEYLTSGDVNIVCKIRIAQNGNSNIVNTLKDVKYKLSENIDNFMVSIEIDGKSITVTSSTTDEQLLTRYAEISGL